MGGLKKAVDAAAKIDGWMYPRELKWLGQTASERQVVVEVGSWKGRSTKMLAAMCPGTVYAVDDLIGQPNEEFGYVSPSEQDDVFRDNLSAEIEAGKVKVVRKPSMEAATDFAPGSVDMVFVDGEHVHPGPLNDVVAWLPTLKPDGLMSGHDWTQVRQSLEEAPGSYDQVCDSIWVKL